MKVSVSFRRRGNLLSKAISIPIAAKDKSIIYSLLLKSVIGRGHPKELGNNGLMTCIQHWRCCIFVAGGKTKWNPRIEFEHIFQRRGKHLSKVVLSTSPQELHTTFTAS
jgi:hypothetical protein